MLENRFGATDAEINAIRGELALAVEQIKSELYADIRPLFWKVMVLLSGASLVCILFTLPIYSMP